ncbi:MAG: helix-turn-helix domain-containing protein [Gammaproteobacteria bacterium]|nr:helix-turn-helix domain-containing protein [Gammaproteobacteria bacterium]
MVSENRTGRPIQDQRIGRLPERLTAAIGKESVRSIADRAGISEGTVRNLLGGGTPRLDNILRIADAAGVSASWLTTGEGGMLRTEHSDQEVVPLKEKEPTNQEVIDEIRSLAARAALNIKGEALTPEELQWLEWYRQMSPEDRELVEPMARRFAERGKDKQEVG